VLFEFKTKSAQIDTLRRIAPAPNLVVAWSLNPPEIVRRHERGTASLEERLVAARRLQDAGYKLAFHFDPVIRFPGWPRAYTNLVEQLFSAVDPARIVWISLGSLRFPPSLGRIMEQRLPGTPLLREEMVRGQDGKLRYLRPLRTRLYRTVLGRIREIDPEVFCYFCMESPVVWKQVMGWAPRSNAHLDYLFVANICRRFLDVTMSPPFPARYAVAHSSRRRRIR
jgi:spore photoproduct lyase